MSGTTRAGQKAIWYTDNKGRVSRSRAPGRRTKSPFDFEQVVVQKPLVIRSTEKTKEVDLQAGKRMGEQAKEHMGMEPDMVMNMAAYYQAAAQNHEIERGIER
jgi:hypothetical protein